MRRILAAFALGAAAGAFGRKAVYHLRLRCAVRGRHNPERLRMGLIGLPGFRCLDCPKTGAKYSDMGFDEDDDHISVKWRA